LVLTKLSINHETPRTTQWLAGGTVIVNIENVGLQRFYSSIYFNRSGTGYQPVAHLKYPSTFLFSVFTEFIKN